MRRGESGRGLGGGWGGWAGWQGNGWEGLRL